MPGDTLDGRARLEPRHLGAERKKVHDIFLVHHDECPDVLDERGLFHGIQGVTSNRLAERFEVVTAVCGAVITSTVGVGKEPCRTAVERYRPRTVGQEF